MIIYKACSVNAPCKINLHLHIKERRSDGYHELESIFAALAFGDTLLFELTGIEESWELLVNNAGAGRKDSFPQSELMEKNLISKAVALFRSRTGFRCGLRCNLQKRIPLSAGLGGGSSDAASALLALDLLAKTHLSYEELEEMAMLLGSDVPFFIQGGAALVKGRGEYIERLPPAGNYSILLVKPPFGSSTLKAYASLDLYREKAALSLNVKTEKAIFAPETQGFGFEELVKIWQSPPDVWPFYNDFLPLLAETGIYREILTMLNGEGALFSGLSGSGSCCFGIFADPEKAMIAEKSVKIRGNTQNFTQLTFFLASGANPVLQ